MILVRRQFASLFVVAMLATTSFSQTLPDGDPGGGGGGANAADYVVVDYDNNGDVVAAYLPGVGLFDDATAYDDFVFAINSEYSAAEVAALLATINGSAADAAVAEQLLAYASGSTGVSGFSLVSTTDATVLNSGTVESTTTTSFVAEAMVVDLQLNGLSPNAAILAVQSLMLRKKSILGIFPQQYIYIETTGGETYYPENGEELEDALQEIEADGDMIDDFVIKGHGSGEMIEIGHDGDILIVSNGDVIIGNTEDPNVFIDITDELDNTTDANSDIILRGCSTAPLAEDLDGALGGDPDVSGAPIPIIGIPWSPWSVGPMYTY